MQTNLQSSSFALSPFAPCFHTLARKMPLTQLCIAGRRHTISKCCVPHRHNDLGLHSYLSLSLLFCRVLESKILNLAGWLNTNECSYYGCCFYVIFIHFIYMYFMYTLDICSTYGMSVLLASWKHSEGRRSFHLGRNQLPLQYVSKCNSSSPKK